MAEEELLVEEPTVYCEGTLIDITTVKPNPDNPNEHPDDQLKIFAGVLRTNGWRQPIVISKRSGMVVKGHGRLQTAKHLKLKRVPVVYQDYADEQAELQDMVADNRVAQHSFTNALKLGSLLKKISTKGAEHLGYSQVEIDLLAASEYVAPKQTDRTFQVLETLKMTKDQKAIVVATIQKFCLKLGKEVEWGEALAAICMAWQVTGQVVPVDMPTPPKAEPAPVQPPQAAPAQPQPVPTAPQAQAPTPAQAQTTSEAKEKPAKTKKKKAENADPVLLDTDFKEIETEIMYVADTQKEGVALAVIRVLPGERYYTPDLEVKAAAQKLCKKRARLLIKGETVHSVEAI
jgi:hypothetical protein